MLANACRKTSQMQSPEVKTPLIHLTLPIIVSASGTKQKQEHVKTQQEAAPDTTSLGWPLSAVLNIHYANGAAAGKLTSSDKMTASPFYSPLFGAPRPRTSAPPWRFLGLAVTHVTCCIWMADG